MALDAITVDQPTSARFELVRCEGDPREMGAAQGAGAKAKILAARDALARLEAFRLQQPWWLPYPLYRRIAEGKAAKFLTAALDRDYPAMSQRITGLAEGSGLSRNALALFNAIEPMLSSVGGCTACPGACSAVAVRGSRSATGEAVIARNFDYLPLVQPFYLMRDCRSNGERRALEFTTAPLAGTVDGVNEDGLCVTYNYAFTTDAPPGPAAPISMVISEALARCRTVTEAADRIASRLRVGGGLLMLADATGDIASLELSSTCSHLRRPAPGEDVLVHTNAFADPRMREVQAPWESVYTDRAPKPLRGKRLHRSSEERDRRFAELLQNTAGPLGPDELGAIMSDHGPSGAPDDYSPCVHGAYWATTATLQLFARSRRVRVAFDSACRAKYQEVSL